MQSTSAFLSHKKSSFSFQIVENLYQQVENFSNTIISLQYGPNHLLSFKVYEASQGTVMSPGSENMAVQCQIRGVNYKLTRQHLEQLSDRECRELFNHLGIQGKN